MADAVEAKKKGPNVVSQEGVPALEALLATKDKDGKVALWMRPADLEPGAKGPMGAFVKQFAAAASQPEMGPKDERGDQRRTGVWLEGESGVGYLKDGFGGGVVRKLYFDADGVAAIHAKSRKQGKEAIVSEAVVEHDAREVDRHARVSAAQAATRARKSADKAKGAER